jgi:iron complex transport system permease protein
MLLAGIAVNVLCSSLSGLMIYLNHDAQQLQTMVFWLMGSLAPSNWKALPWPVLAMTLGTLFFWGQRRNLNLIMLGDEEAFSLGLNPGKYRFLYLAAAALITSSCVSQFGMIGFIGIVIPHIIRFFVGGDHTRLAPFSFLTGSVCMVWVDMFARTLSSSEIPLGIITGLLGSPFFFWLLLKPARQ